MLEHDVEAYVVHLMANNMERTDIGSKIIAIELMQASQRKNKDEYRKIGDECLLIHSYPFKKQKWPSSTYYQDMGTIAYGFAHHIMEKKFTDASKIIYSIFNRS